MVEDSAYLKENGVNLRKRKDYGQLSVEQLKLAHFACSSVGVPSLPLRV